MQLPQELALSFRREGMKFCKIWKQYFGLLVLLAGTFSSTLFARPLSIAMVTAEHIEYFYSGGLGHAVAGLGKALNQEDDYKLSFLMPAYDTVMDQKLDLEKVGQNVSVGVDYEEGQPRGFNSYQVLRHKQKNGEAERIFFRHQPKVGEEQYFANSRPEGEGKIYAPAELKAKAFGTWNKAVAEHILSSNYDLIVLNEWHTGFVASFLQEARLLGKPTPKIVFAVHNMGYTEPMNASLVDFINLPRSQFSPEGMEYHGSVSPFKAGFEFSDFAYAVSEKYSEEVQTTRFSGDLAGLAQKKNQYGRLSGILNGIDEEEWDPKTGHDGKLGHKFSPDDLAGKERGKESLQAEFKLKKGKDIPIFVMTSRVSEQKGMDYTLDAIRDYLGSHEAQVILTGDADQAKYRTALDELARDFPDKFRQMSFDSAAEHKLLAYGDLFLNAPLWEPSGLNQMYAMKNATPPVVSSVGGLVDSVEDGVSGFRFDVILNGDESVNVEKTRDALSAALRKAHDVFVNDRDAYLKMQQAAMAQQNSWKSRLPKFREMFNFVRNDGPLGLGGRSCGAEIIRFAGQAK